MKKIYQYILLAVALVATASCSNELDDALQPVENGNLQFVVSDFPAFGEDPQTRASNLGTPDAGKTDWEAGDVIIVSLASAKYGAQTATLTYNGDAWTSSGNLACLEDETPTVSAVYNPCAENPGMGEYLVASCAIQGNQLSVSFESTERTYSRLRIVAETEQELIVSTTGFTPAGPVGATAPESYTLTTDDNGNAFLYGTFAESATVSVKLGDVTLKDYTFTVEEYPYGTEQGMSYALDARPLRV